jgi:hypothetical protein
LSDIIPEDLIPYVNSSSLSLYQGYNFKGYSLVEGSSTIVSDNYIVNGNATLWAVFNLEEDIRKIVHPEWFNVEFFTYNQQELDT